MRFADALARPGLRRDRGVQAALAVDGRHPPGRTTSSIVAARTRANGARAISVLVDARFAGTIGRPARGARGDDAAAAREGLLLDRGAPARAARGGRRRGAPDPARPRRRDGCARCCAYARELGLDTLVEAHDAAELAARDRSRRADRSASTRATSATFAIDRARSSTSSRRAPRRPDRDRRERRHTRAQAAAAELAGADAILVGTALMQAADPARSCASCSRARS